MPSANERCNVSYLRLPRFVFLAALTALTYLPGDVGAATIQYVATDLPDVTPGENLWRYDYAVTGRTFLASQFFDIYFDASLYGSLTVLNAPSDWVGRILGQPNPANFPPFDRGIFDAEALANNPAS